MMEYSKDRHKNGPLEDRRAGGVTVAEVKKRTVDPSRASRLEVPLSPFCIRIPTPAEPLPCKLCGRIFRTGGPTGYLATDVVCDACLLVGERQLGMAMTMVAVCRFYGSLRPTHGAEEAMHRRELLAFARVYERYAGQFGPARPWSNFLSDPGLS